MPKHRLLFVGEGVSLAHVSRPLVLARSLDESAFEVHFACDPRYHGLVKKELPYATIWPLQSATPDEFVSASERGSYYLSTEGAEGYVGEEVRLIKDVRPSLVIGDFRHTLSISSALCDVKYSSLLNATWSPYRALDFDPVPKSATPLPSNVTWPVGSRYRSAAQVLNQVREGWGLPFHSGFCDVMSRGDYTLYAEPEGFIKTTPLPENHLFMGAVIWSPMAPRPAWWGRWDQRKPLIYITLGSTGAIGLLPSLLRALEDEPVSIVVATAGRSANVSSSGTVFIADFVPGIEMCGEASLVVCSGGSGTAYQALSQGTPVVGIWSNIDQYLTISSIEENGAGIGCSVAEFEADDVKQMVRACLDDRTFAEQARAVALRMTGCDPSTRFPEFARRVLSIDS